MDGLSCYRKLPIFYVFRAYGGNGHGLAGFYIFGFISVRDKIFQKTADKRKEAC